MLPVVVNVLPAGDVARLVIAPAFVPQRCDQDEMKCDRWVLSEAGDSHPLRIPNKSGICHSQSPPIAVVITREGVFLELIFAILSARCAAGGPSHFKRIRNWGRKMWNYAKFIALAMSASAGTLSTAFDNGALNASETGAEA